MQTSAYLWAEVFFIYFEYHNTMKIKGLFSNRSALFQFGVLIYFAFMGLLFASLIDYLVVTISNYLTGSTPALLFDRSFYLLQGTQFTSSTFIFLMPALCTAYLCSKKPLGYLNIEKITDIRTLILTAFMVILISPSIDITAYMNSKMHLPEFMSPVESFMRKAEDLAAQVTEKILSEQGVFPFIVNIFIVGIMAGLTEEFFFRGALTSVIGKKIKNPHITIWTVAILFSAVHFQFFGFIPRMLLGAFLGYLLYWTHSIWVPVFAHFLNNSIAVVGYKMGLFETSTEGSSLITSEMETSELFITIAAAIAGLILFVFCAKKMKSISQTKEKEIDSFLE